MPMVLCLEIVNVNIHPYYFQYFHSSTIFIQNYFSFIQQQYCSTMIHPLHSHSCVQQIALMFVKQWRKNNYFSDERHSYSIGYGYALAYYLKSLFLKFIVKHILETKVAMVHSSFPTLYLKYKEIWVFYVAHDLIAHLSNNVFSSIQQIASERCMP